MGDRLRKGESIRLVVKEHEIALSFQTWESLTEDADGLIEMSVSDLIQRARRKRMLDKTNRKVRLGMMRHVYVVLDLSESMNMQVRVNLAYAAVRRTESVKELPPRSPPHGCLVLQDLKPTRLRCCLKLLEGFVEEFFYLNPISQLGLITTRGKRAEVASELAGNPRKHAAVLKNLESAQCRGEPSLQNSLEVALQSLRHMPGHASREVGATFLVHHIHHYVSDTLRQPLLHNRVIHQLWRTTL